MVGSMSHSCSWYWQSLSLACPSVLAAFSKLTLPSSRRRHFFSWICVQSTTQLFVIVQSLVHYHRYCTVLPSCLAGFGQWSTKAMTHSPLKWPLSTPSSSSQVTSVFASCLSFAASSVHATASDHVYDLLIIYVHVSDIFVA